MKDYCENSVGAQILSAIFVSCIFFLFAKIHLQAELIDSLHGKIRTNK